MRIKLTLFATAMFMFAFLAPNLVRAQGTADAFSKYTNPHSICDYYRTQATGFAVERVSDNECLVSLGTGKFKTFTQYYYSKDNWCYKIIQEGRTVHSNCVPRPDNSLGFTNEEFTKFAPYIVVIIVLVVILAAVSGATATAPSAATSSPAFQRRQGVKGKKRPNNKRPRIWRELGPKK